MILKLKCGFLTALTLTASMAWADTLELKNGSLIKGKFLGGTETEVSFQVGSTVQKYNVADIVSIKFDSEGAANAPAPQPQSSLPDDPGAVAHVEMKPAYVTIPAGTQTPQSHGTYDPPESHPPKPQETTSADPELLRECSSSRIDLDHSKASSH